MNVVNAGSRFQVYGEEVQTFKTLPPATYTIGFHPQMGFWLEHRPNLSSNENVIYGNHEQRANKILRSYDQSNRNFGVILSGKKGIGKSLLARIIAEKAIQKDMPVIIVDAAIPGTTDFLSSIEQEVVIIFDEFEKIFAKRGEDHGDPQVELLSLFDGLDNGKKLFIITCNCVSGLNEFLVNRPGRFHYHFEIACPSNEEVSAYMRDKVGDGFDEEIEKIVKLSQMVDVTYDALRAIAFDLKLGYPLEETLEDLNINYERDNSFDVTMRLSNGAVLQAYSKRISLYDREQEHIRFYVEKGGEMTLRFIPSDIDTVDGVLCLKGSKCSIIPGWGMFADTDEGEKARKEYMETVKVESVTFTKVLSSEVNKYNL